MRDKHQRTIEYMRVSITDRCNLRCVYCMPKEGIVQTIHDEILSYETIIHMVRIASKLGIRKFKITGGEPLARKNAPALIKAIKDLPGIEQVTLTTNGILMGECLEELASYGLDAINISLDTMDRELYQEITGYDLLPKVLDNLEKALDCKQFLLKINCVLMGMPKQNPLEIASLAKDKPVHVRFIEMMPIGHGKGFGWVSEQEIKTEITKNFGTMTPFNERLGNGPGHYFEIPGFQGKIGFISAMSHQFCNRCNRVRLDSQGYLKACLQYDAGRDLKALLRGGATDEELLEAMRSCIFEKPSGHAFQTRAFHERLENRKKETLSKETLSMAKIGG